MSYTIRIDGPGGPGGELHATDGRMGPGFAALLDWFDGMPRGDPIPTAASSDNQGGGGGGLAT